MAGSKLFRKSLVLLLTGFLSSYAFSIPDYKLVDQDGKSFQLYSLKGSFVFISFIFTRCPMPKMCPLTVTLNKKLLAEWKKKFPKKELKLLLITMDPEFDTPVALSKFAKTRDLDLKHFILLTGNEKTIDDFESQFNVLAIPENGGVSHNNRSAMLAPDFSEIGLYKENGWEPKTIFEDVQKFLEKPPAATTK